MYCILVSASQEIENSITGCFWLEVTHEVAVKTSFRAVITSKSLTKAGRSTSQMPHSDAVGRRLYFFIGSLSVGAAWITSQHGSSAGFSQSPRVKEEQNRATIPETWPRKSHSVISSKS